MSLDLLPVDSSIAHVDHSELSDDEFEVLKQKTINGMSGSLPTTRLAYGACAFPILFHSNLPPTKEPFRLSINTNTNFFFLAKNLAYAPYSNFRVGAAVLTASGVLIDGANVENASYGACICAERTTIVRSVAMGHKKFKAIGVSTDLADKIGSPCGICRQVIREFGQNIPLFLFNNDGSKYFKVYLKDILPLSFGPSDLGKPEHDA